MGSSPWAASWTVLALAGAVRALLFWDGFASKAHSDNLGAAVPATQILAGTFPVYKVGVEYHGAVPSYPLAVWFMLASPSTLAHDLFAAAIGVGVVWTGYLLARRLLQPWPAFLAGLALAVPPLVFARWSTTGNLVYPFIPLVGNGILLGTQRILSGRGASPAALLVTGLLAGLGWWASPLIIVYCAPLAVLALRTRLIVRPRFWLFPLGVLLGGLPAWVYDVVNFPSARLMLHKAGTRPPEPLFERVTIFMRTLSPELLGARAAELATVQIRPPTAVQVIVVCFSLVVMARAFVRDRRELAWIVGRPATAVSGLGILWIVLVTNLALVLPARRAIGITYFLPLFSVLPLWTGEFIGWLWQVRRWAGMVVLASVFGFHLWTIWDVSLGRRTDAEWRWAELRDDTQPLLDWLTQHHTSHIYYDYEDEHTSILAFELTFLAGTSVTAAHPWHEAVVQHGWAVDAQLSPPYVVPLEQAEGLRESLKALGQPVRETHVGSVAVLEIDPAPPRQFIALSPDHWTVTASHRPLAVHHLVDRDAATQWSTGRSQQPGQWIAVDLGAEEEVARVDLLAIDWQEVPAGLRIDWSRDGQTWTETTVSVSHYWGPLFLSGPHPFLRTRRGRVQAIFDPVRARFLRIVQTGTGDHPWSARELFVYRPATAVHTESPPASLTSTLRREGVRFVYADHWLSARVLAEGNGSIGAFDSNINVNSYGRALPPPTSLERFRLKPGRALLLDHDADLAGARRMLELRGAIGREVRVGSYPLILLKAPAARQIRDRDTWRITASVNGPDTSRALDGDRRTRWSAGTPLGPDVVVTLDLGRPSPVGGLRMVPGTRDGGPAAFTLERSFDGLQWTPIERTEWVGPLYWTGYELLRNSLNEWTVAFPRVDLRFLRIRPALAARTWDLDEIDLLE